MCECRNAPANVELLSFVLPSTTLPPTNRHRAAIDDLPIIPSKAAFPS
jgi:hypothetical protein